jgi:SpoVK/Ycf46/Vps4 family AAA+-type ATPase
MGTLDAKLTHLVRKFLSLSVDSEPNTDHIVQYLRMQHREYQRKDMIKLKKEVHKVLKQLEQSKHEGDTAAVIGFRSNGNKDKDEEEYDKDAEAHDLKRSTNDNGGLNESLTAQYRKMHQNRAGKATTFAADTEGIPADITSCENTPHPSLRRLNKRLRADSGTPSLGKHSGTTNGKSFKRKNSLSKRNSSSSGVDLDAYKQGENNRRETVSVAICRPTERYADLGGIEEILKQIRQLVEYPLIRPELYRHLGVDPPRGVLLRGPPG